MANAWQVTNQQMFKRAGEMRIYADLCLNLAARLGVLDCNTEHKERNAIKTPVCCTSHSNSSRWLLLSLSYNECKQLWQPAGVRLTVCG